MACEGIIPCDKAVFADTGNEPQKVYDHIKWSIKHASQHGIEVTVVSGGNLKEDVLNTIPNPDGGRVAALPYHLLKPSGDKSMGMRTCTSEYKLKPIEKYLRQHVLGLKPRQRAPKEVKIEVIIGISQDEATRAKPSMHKFAKNVFPFLSWGMDSPDGKTWRRYQIENWLKENYPDIEVVRSACLVCPFHDNRELRKIKENPKEWEDVCSFDDAIREDKRGKIVSLQFLHRSCKPLREVDIRSDEEKGQGNMFDNECEGICGL
tara:strand:+ start:789 stop:1577 length:789 start_codon:yes stop_codon:yes gene_type:complete